MADGWMVAQWVCDWVLGMWRWCFGARLTLEGGTRVYKGAPLAEGGYSTVYAATDAATGAALALKLVRCAEPEQREAALREIRAHRCVEHDPHVLRLVDSAMGLVVDGRAYAALAFPRYVRGTLRDAINARVLLGGYGPPWRPAELVRVLEGVARGLAALHAAGLAHRDVKPENVLLSADSFNYPRAVLVDLGSTAPLETPVATRRDALNLQDHAASHTTMPYRPPELWEPVVPSVVDAKADVWALGCLLWAAAFGYSPFESEFPHPFPPATTLGARPRIVETSYSRILARPASPPVESLPKLRDHAVFYANLDKLARTMFHLDPAKRPGLDDCLAGITGLVGDDAIA